MSFNQSDFQSTGRGHFKVTGDLTFNSVAIVWDKAKNILPSLEEDNLTIDIGSAVELDSGGLALLVAWSRWAYCNKKNLTYHNASDKVRKLTEINKLQDLLKFA